MDMLEAIGKAFGSSKAPQHHLHVHPPHIPHPEEAERLRRIEVLLSDVLRSNYALLERVTHMAIDTSAALTAVRNLTGDNASLRELLNQVQQKVVDISQQLANAQASGNGGIDAATAAQIQSDLNTIATLADTEDASVKAAIQANSPATPPDQPPATPPAAAPADGTTAQPINNTGNPS
jgi:hypothetical protein